MWCRVVACLCSQAAAGCPVACCIVRGAALQLQSALEESEDRIAELSEKIRVVSVRCHMMRCIAPPLATCSTQPELRCAQRAGPGAIPTHTPAAAGTHALQSELRIADETSKSANEKARQVSSLVEEASKRKFPSGQPLRWRCGCSHAAASLRRRKGRRRLALRIAATPLWSNPQASCACYLV